MALQRRTELKRTPFRTKARRCCGKTAYATREAAEAAIFKISLVSSRDKTPRRAYEGSCGWWHLTSMADAATDAATLPRRTELRPQSRKRQKANQERRAAVRETFGDQPVCAVPSCGRWADDVHEPLTRARGGSIVDPDNMAPLCRPHHDEITVEEPAWAYALGLLKHSWDDLVDHPGTDRLIADLKTPPAGATAEGETTPNT